MWFWLCLFFLKYSFQKLKTFWLSWLDTTNSSFQRTLIIQNISKTKHYCLFSETQAQMISEKLRNHNMKLYRLRVDCRRHSNWLKYFTKMLMCFYLTGLILFHQESWLIKDLKKNKKVKEIPKLKSKESRKS